MKIFTKNTTLLLSIVALLFTATACGRKSPSGKPSNVDYYTCAMHPSVRSQDPKGKCPICSMDLVPVMKQSGGATPGSSPPKEQSKDAEAKRSRGERKIKYYKSTMMAGEVSAKPAKDSMGMD